MIGRLMDNDLFIEQILVGPMANFVYLIGSNETREVVLVDPAWQVDGLIDYIAEKDYTLKAALITHYHPDHCGGKMGGQMIEGVAKLLETAAVKIYIHKQEAAGLKKITGISDSDIVKVESDDKLSLGRVDISFLHTPGHTPGSQCFKVRNNLVSGDTLFISGCGRVDLPGSNSDDMFHSLQKLSALPDDTILLPGHNYAAKSAAMMSEIKQINPALSATDLTQWRQNNR